MRVYQRISQLLLAISNCDKSPGCNPEWRDRHWLALAAIMDTAPSGSGIDCGTKLLPDSTPERLRFQADFHHMSESGMYAGWTSHVVTVKASLWADILINISGRDRAGIKDYLGDVYHDWLLTDVVDLKGLDRAHVD